MSVVKMRLTVLVLLLVSFFEASSQDSLQLLDIQNLRTIVRKGIVIPDSIISSPKGEVILLEIQMKNNKVDKVRVWHSESRFMASLGREIAKNIETDWIPVTKFPNVVLLPVAVGFMTDPPQKDSNSDLVFGLSTLKGNVQSGNVLILQPSGFYFAAKPYRRTHTEKEYRNLDSSKSRYK